MYKRLILNKNLKIKFSAASKRIFNSTRQLSSKAENEEKNNAGATLNLLAAADRNELFSSQTEASICESEQVDTTEGPTIEIDSKTVSLESSSASTLVIGGGIVGTSLAYHLAKQGEKDVMLLEKNELTAGSTWHAAGLTTSYNTTINLRKIQYYSINMYARIASETGQEIGFHQPGSIRVATNPVEVDELRFQMAKGGIQQAPQYMLTPEEIKEKVPLIEQDKVLMGLFTPYDGYVDPYSLTQAIAKGARIFGASILQGVEVTALNLREDGRWRVGTSRGEVTADRVINAAGFWAKDIGKLAGLDLPLVPVHHQYLVTSSVAEIQALKREFPVLRFLEASCYVRQERDGFLIGPYESEQAVNLSDEWSRDGVPKDFGKELFPPDLERMTPYLEKVMELIPSFSSASIQSVVNGPITYTPEALPLVGPSILPNMWLAAGFGYGIVLGGGVGKFLTDWIQNGEPNHDLTECDPGRFSSWTTDEYVFAKARESYGMHSAPIYPHEERFAGRPTSRITTAYEKQKQRGASMVIDAGWEHPGWFAPLGEQPEYKPSFGRTNWHSAVKREWETVTKSAGVIDLSASGKFILEGPQAVDLIDYIAANRVPSLGRSVVTHLLTLSAKVLAQLTVTRLAPDQFLMITGSGSEIHDLRWMQEVVRKEGWKANFRNVSDEIGVLSVAGPKSKEILSKLHPRFKEKFPSFTSDKLSIKGIDATALKLTSTGELGWELYVSKDDTGKLYDAILEAGEGSDLGDFGALTLNVLRLEKGFRLWGKEMNHDRNIVEAGLMPFVDMQKKDFIGKRSIEKIIMEQLDSELVMVKIDPKAEYDPVGDETIWIDQKVVGNTTSGCFSYHLNQPLAFAYLPRFLTTPGTTVEVEMMTRKYEAEVLPRPPELTYDEKLEAKS